LPPLHPRGSKRNDILDFLLALPIRLASPISISFLPDLTVARGQLLSSSDTPGKPVYAASFIKERRIVLETPLLNKPNALRLILVHELGHFIWPRLGNKVRAEFESLLAAEFESKARGEAGESEGVAKSAVTADDVLLRTKRWREYACEAFCDSAALLYSGVSRWKYYTLARKWRARREKWFQTAIHWEVRCF
jgi:hypothetical protein